MGQMTHKVEFHCFYLQVNRHRDWQLLLFSIYICILQRDHKYLQILSHHLEHMAYNLYGLTLEAPNRILEQSQERFLILKAHQLHPLHGHEQNFHLRAYMYYSHHISQNITKTGNSVSFQNITSFLRVNNCPKIFLLST